MPLETGSFINDLTPSNPPNSDPAGQGDDHLRLIKTTVQGTFPQMGAIFGQIRRQDVAVSISSIWNTNHFICSASATATVVLTLPPASSITSGFYVDITTIGTGTVSLLPSGAASINGGTSLSIPRLSTARAYFTGGTAWLADVVGHGQGGTSVVGNLAVDGTLSVSGAATLAALTVNGIATMSAAVHMKSTLSVSGATALSALTVAGIATMSAAVHMKSTLSISGAFSLLGAAKLSGALTVAGTTTLSGTVVLSNGQLEFPAAQNASAGANTLDDYEEGTWTPALTFATPGNLSVSYTARFGEYTKIGDSVRVSCRVNATQFTHTTASGDARITGLPFAPAPAVGSATAVTSLAVGPIVGVAFGGTFTQLTAYVEGANTFANLAANDMQTTRSSVTLTTGGLPTGSAKDLHFSGVYKVPT